MRNLLTGVAVAAGMFGIGATQAGAAEFEGGLKDEPQASLSIVVKKIEGARYVTRIKFENVPVKCENGQSLVDGAGPAGQGSNPGLRVRQREFSGPWRYGKIDGKFKGGGKLTGEISITVNGDQAHGECRSGRLGYVVRDD